MALLFLHPRRYVGVSGQRHAPTAKAKQRKAVPVHAMKTYEAAGVRLCSFVTSTLDRG